MGTDNRYSQAGVAYLRRILAVCFCLFVVRLGWGQELETVQSIRYFKAVEPNRTADGRYNLSGKRYDVEKLLVGDFNAQIEYFYAPSFDGAASLRIYRDSLNQTCLLETKRITNWDEVNDYINKKYTPPSAGIRVLLSPEQERQIRERSRIMNDSIINDRLSRYRVHNRTIQIGGLLKETLYSKLKDAISSQTDTQPEMGVVNDHLENKVFKPGDSIVTIKTVTLIEDGTTSIFRCVVGDELWSLNYHIPEGEYKTLSDLFRQMIADVEAECFAEEKYIEAFANCK